MIETTERIHGAIAPDAKPDATNETMQSFLELTFVTSNDRRPAEAATGSWSYMRCAPLSNG